MPRGVKIRIPLADLFTSAEQHAAGWSLRSIARMRYRQWGYASQGTALEALRKALRLIDAPVRDRVEACVLASTMHGRSRRAAARVGHPDHAEYLAHQRERTTKDTTRCLGVVQSYHPHKGQQCRRRVAGSETYCHVHREQA